MVRVQLVILAACVHPRWSGDQSQPCTCAIKAAALFTWTDGFPWCASSVGAQSIPIGASKASVSGNCGRWPSWLLYSGRLCWMDEWGKKLHTVSRIKRACSCNLHLTSFVCGFLFAWFAFFVCSVWRTSMACLPLICACSAYSAWFVVYWFISVHFIFIEVHDCYAPHVTAYGQGRIIESNALF